MSAIQLRNYYIYSFGVTANRTIDRNKFFLQQQKYQKSNEINSFPIFKNIEIDKALSSNI